MTDQKAMKLALEALENSGTDMHDIVQYQFEIKAIKALEEALAKQEQGEPVAWIEHHKGGDNLNWEEVNHPYAKATPLYTTPQQRKPLTDEQLQAICNSLSRQDGWDGDGWDLALKEAIEAAHGIK
jgi:hypothetical protein